MNIYLLLKEKDISKLERDKKRAIKNTRAWNI